MKLEIGDYGKGVRVEVLKWTRDAMAPLGVGIQGVGERMRQLSGRLEVTSRPNKGTIVTATLPIREQRPETVADSPSHGDVEDADFNTKADSAM